MTEKEFKKQLLNDLYATYENLSDISLDTSGATKIVYGVGNPAAKIMIIGEAPGRNEDQKGEPFVGRSGQLLTKTLEKLGVSRDEVYITNTVKCRPPENRTPTQEEIDFYKNTFLEKEIKIVQPKVILLVGAVALTALLGGKEKISKIRGRKFMHGNTVIIPTYHPAYILRNPNAMDIFSGDIKKAIEISKQP